jgi:hypothetical protein
MMHFIIKLSIKKLDTKFNSIGDNCELRFNNKTIIEKCNSSISIVKNEQIKLTEIEDISNKKTK